MIHQTGNLIRCVLAVFCLSATAYCAVPWVNIGSNRYDFNIDHWEIGGKAITSRNLHNDLNTELLSGTLPNIFFQQISTLVNESNKSNKPGGHSLSDLMAAHILTGGHLDLKTLKTKPNQGVFCVSVIALQAYPNLPQLAKVIADGISDGSLVSSISKIQGYWPDPVTGAKTGFANTVDIFMDLLPGRVFRSRIASVAVGQNIQNTTKAKLTLRITDQGKIGNVEFNAAHPVP